MRAQSANQRDRVVGDLADRQHGVVSREQLVARGLDRGAIVRGLEAGRLRPVFRGVYAVGHLALRREGWWMAALLACGEGAALSHGTAAALWDLRAGPTLPVHVVTGRAAGRKHDAIVAHRMRLPAADTMARDGLRVTTPARAIVDPAGMLNGRALREAVERAQDVRRFDPEDIRSTLARIPRRSGTRQLADLLALMQPDRDSARSHLERLLLPLTRRARLPRPDVNREIAGHKARLRLARATPRRRGRRPPLPLLQAGRAARQPPRPPTDRARLATRPLHLRGGGLRAHRDPDGTRRPLRLTANTQSHPPSMPWPRAKQDPYGEPPPAASPCTRNAAARL